jgi:hypothetical protein
MWNYIAYTFNDYCHIDYIKHVMYGAYSTHGKMKNLYKNLSRKYQERTLLEKPGGRGDVTKMDLKLMQCQSMSWIRGILGSSGRLFRIWQKV